jgi:hypothetical protein
MWCSIYSIRERVVNLSVLYVSSCKRFQSLHTTRIIALKTRDVSVILWVNGFVFWDMTCLFVILLTTLRSSLMSPSSRTSWTALKLQVASCSETSKTIANLHAWSHRMPICILNVVKNNDKCILNNCFFVSGKWTFWICTRRPSHVYFLFVVSDKSVRYFRKVLDYCATWVCSNRYKYSKVSDEMLQGKEFSTKESSQTLS